MQSVKNLFSFVVYSNLWIALAATSMYVATCFILHLPIELYLLLPFGGTLVAYNYLRVRNLGKMNHSLSPMIVWMSRYKMVVYIFMALGIALLGYALFLTYIFKPQAILIVAIAGLLSGFYAGINIKWNIRRIGLLKTPLVAMVWMLITALYPLSLYSIPFSNHWALLLSQFLFILALTMPFEIKDLMSDSGDKLLKTIPMVIGEKGTIIISLISLFASLLLLVWVYKLVWLFPFFLLIGFTLTQLNQQKSPFWYWGLIDGYLVVYGILVWLIR